MERSESQLAPDEARCSPTPMPGLGTRVDLRRSSVVSLPTGGIRPMCRTDRGNGPRIETCLTWPFGATGTGLSLRWGHWGRCLDRDRAASLGTVTQFNGTPHTRTPQEWTPLGVEGPWQTTTMSGVAHPFAGGGGGHHFECKVATLLAGDLVVSRHTEHGGVVAAIEMQTGPWGFEDLQVSVELLGGGNRTIHAQCRYKQPFTVANVKFAELIAQAATAICGDELTFATGEKRLAVIVDSGSPGHTSMTMLCDLARDPGDFDRFVGVVEAHGGRIQGRWEHCLGAADDLEPELLHRVLGALDVRTVEVRSETSRDSIELINQLAAVWIPRDYDRAMNLGNALFRYLADKGPTAGMIDLSYLQSRLRPHMPNKLGAATRRARLRRRRDGGHQRVAMTMKAIGLDDDEASMLAARAVETPPSIAISRPLTVVSGAMGVGKTTELERIHRVAIDRALEEPNAPIPVFLQAREVGSSPLLAAVSVHTEGLGDPSRVGAHLIIDGLDEAGVQITDLTSRIASLQAEWPNSTVILGTRPQATPPGLETVVVEALTPEAAEELMEVIHPGVAIKWLRQELTEVLCRPLFAIRFALNRRQGNLAGTSHGQLIGSVGRQALDDIGDTTDSTFGLLVRLACSVVDSGGRPVNVRSLRATPAQVAQLIRSRIVQAVDGNASFQLAALTEWFAATALLRDPSMLTHSVSSELSAHRWRYVFVQALLQGSANEVDNVMSTLLSHTPATAAWVHHEARTPRFERRSTPPAASVQEAGARIRRAAESWLEPWSNRLGWSINDGELPTLGVSMDDQHLVTAWLLQSGATLDRVVPLSPDVHPLANSNSPWAGAKSGSPRNGENWPWDWTRDQFQRTIDGYFQGRELLVDIDLCWPELAWDFAHHMLGRGSRVQSRPVRRSDLEAEISKHRALVGPGEAYIGRRREDWSLTEGEAFVADLARRGVSEIRSPWPPANTRGESTCFWWTTEQLLARLRQATKTALDVYQAIVDRYIPAMAQELHIYQLLPGRIVGWLTPGDPDKGYEGAHQYRWHIEPLPKDSPNDAQWSVCHRDDQLDDDEWEPRNTQVRAMRGDLAERITLYTHYGEPQIYSPTPAGHLALKLLGQDLSGFKWLTRSSGHYANARSVRPRYTRQP